MADDALIEISSHFTISDLNVRINLTHGSLFDLQIILQSRETSVVLNQAGNSAFITKDTNGRLIALGGSGWLSFDDEAVFSIEQATDPFTGSFRPLMPYQLSEFRREGRLRKLAFENFRCILHAHTGILNGFEITFAVPEPSTAVFSIIGAGGAILSGHRRKR